MLNTNTPARHAQIGLRCLLGLLLAGFCAACGGSSGDGGDADSGKDAGEPNDKPGEAGSSGGGGSSPDADGGPDGSMMDPDPEFQGIPTELVPFGVAPKGCTSADDGSGTLTLELDTDVKVLQLAAPNGVLEANGVACTAATDPTNVAIKGSDADDTVIIDFSSGTFPESLRVGLISIDVGAGKDLVAVAGTRAADDVHLGTLAEAVMLRVHKQLPKLQALKHETLIVSTGPGADRIDASGGVSLGSVLAMSLTAFGGADEDTINGGMGNDYLHGGSGDDLFKTAASADGGDVYDGGGGTDTLWYELRTASVVIDVDMLANDGQDGEHDDVQDNVETLIGGAGNDTISAGAADNTLIGAAGDDTLNGGSGDDLFLESAGARGSDVMNGGPGTDLIDYAGRIANLTVTLCLAADSCTTGACGCVADGGEPDEQDVLANIESAKTGSGDDKLTGTAADNTFNAGAGNDELRGEGGDDTLYGDLGDDILIGGPGEDLLDGDLGSDTFDGGDGQGDICILRITEAPTHCELY